MDPRRQSVPEAGAYRMVQGALIELQGAERRLTLIQQAALISRAPSIWWPSGRPGPSSRRCCRSFGRSRLSIAGWPAKPCRRSAVMSRAPGRTLTTFGTRRLASPSRAPRRRHVPCWTGGRGSEALAPSRTRGLPDGPRRADHTDAGRARPRDRPAGLAGSGTRQSPLKPPDRDRGAGPCRASGADLSPLRRAVPPGEAPRARPAAAGPRDARPGLAQRLLLTGCGWWASPRPRSRAVRERQCFGGS